MMLELTQTSTSNSLDTRCHSIHDTMLGYRSGERRMVHNFDIVDWHVYVMHLEHRSGETLVLYSLLPATTAKPFPGFYHRIARCMESLGISPWRPRYNMPICPRNNPPPHLERFPADRLELPTGIPLLHTYADMPVLRAKEWNDEDVPTFIPRVITT
ncbi:hypothetical protein M413DRAFT_25720 [Hebeloma cylindrosporum]|uniref:Uncharacterized protein n=1 Tax=Hebeloma cylindrosporum TaxID=76867 RepID=A0A0C3CJL9_HEBCY|nr:hypothetical protein M413DRAFT_25720 [Hebeloma cylindrosporum h7]